MSRSGWIGLVVMCAAWAFAGTATDARAASSDVDGDCTVSVRFERMQSNGSTIRARGVQRCSGSHGLVTLTVALQSWSVGGGWQSINMLSNGGTAPGSRGAATYWNRQSSGCHWFRAVAWSQVRRRLSRVVWTYPHKAGKAC